MSNTMIQKGKRALAAAMVVSTVVSTMGMAVFTPLVVKAAVMPGDLIKASEYNAVYYLSSDMKRWVFPNPTTYFSWYGNFAGVKTVPLSELQSYPLGGNVTMRPGTKLVKITTDPKVYAVEPGGVLRHLDSEATAKALYGDNWASRVVDVPDAFFVNYKTTGAAVTATSGYPTGSLVKFAGSADTYYVDGATIRKFTGSALSDNNYKASDVSTAPAGWTASAGTDITGKEAKIVDMSGAGATTPVVVTGGVSVSLSPKSPAATAIPGGSFYAPLLTLSVKNTTNADVFVRGLTVRREGIASDSDISGVTVTDSMGVLHGSLVTFGRSVATAGFAMDPIKVMAGTTADVSINVNLRAITSTGTLSGTILSASDITITDVNNVSVAVTGSFPIRGATMSTVSGTGAIGKLKVSTRTIIGGSAGAEIALDQGIKDQDIAKFRFQEVTGNEDVELTNLTIQNNGSASAGDFYNIRLVDQNNAVIASVMGVTNNEAKFVITGLTGVNAGPRGGYKIPEGQLRDFLVRVDFAANTNSANRTINFTIQNDYRVRAVGLETGVGVTPEADTGQTYPIGDNDDTGANFVKFREGSVSISRATGSASGKIAKGATNVQLAKFDIRAFGEDIELQELGFVIKGASGGLGVGRFALNGTVKVLNETGATIYSQTASDTNLYGTNTNFTITNNVITGAAANGTGTQRVLNSFYTVNSGKVGTISFVADVNQNATGADNYTVEITSFKVRRVSSNNFVTTTSAVSGNNLSVDDSTLTVSKASDFNPTNLVKGGAPQKIGSYTLRAGAAEGQTINAIKIRVGASATPLTTTAQFDSTSATDLQNVSNVTLKSGNVDLSPANNISTNAGVTYSISNYKLNANETKTIDVYAVVNTAFAPANIGTEFTVTSAVGSQSQATTIASPVIGQSLALLGSGNLQFTSLGTDGIINVAKLLKASETDVSAFKFQVRENLNAEPVTIQKLYLGVRNAANNLSDSYKLFDADTNTQVGTTVGSTNGEVRFTGLNYAVGQGGVKNLLVKVSTPSGATVPLGASTVRDVTMGVTFVEFTGGSSGTTQRVSGGLGTAYNAATSPDTVTVNDVTNFEVGDTVQIDYNNDGDFADTVDGVAESVVGTVATIGATTITLTGIDRAASAGFVANGRVSSFTFTSENHHVEETKPILASKDVGTGSQIIENPIGTFTVMTSGVQPITPVSMRFEISGSYNANSGFGPKRFRLDRADPNTGARISNTLGSPAPLSGATLVYTLNTATTEAGTTAASTFAKGTTVITGTGFAGDVGDRVAFGAENNGGVGYRLVSVSATSLTITPGLQNAIPGSQTVTSIASNPVVGDTAVLESGQVIQFTMPSGEQVAINSTNGYVLLADTTSIKDNSAQGTTATTAVRILGSKAVSSASNGFTWSYIRTANGSSSGSIDLSDSYIVTGKSILYQ